MKQISQETARELLDYCQRLVLYINDEEAHSAMNLKTESNVIITKAKKELGGRNG